jgi:hypothetical protein
MFTNQLSEDTLEFHLPDWAYAGMVLALMLTLLAAIYIFFGTVLAIAYFITLTTSVVLWSKTTFRRRRMRRVIPHVVLGLVLLLIHNVELWLLDFPSEWTQSGLGIDAPAFGMKTFMGFYFFSVLGLGLLAVFFTFFHNHFGNFLTWFIFIHGIVFSLVCIGGFLFSQPTIYFPGLLSTIPLSIVCIGGIKFIVDNYRG